MERLTEKCLNFCKEVYPQRLVTKTTEAENKAAKKGNEHLKWEETETQVKTERARLAEGIHNWKQPGTVFGSVKTKYMYVYAIADPVECRAFEG